MIKLHLGCGNNHIPGFINIDSRELNAADEIDDISTLSKYKEKSVDLIYASHVLEHTGRVHSMKVLRRWHHILKVNGILRVAVPDLGAVFAHYHEHKNLRVLTGFLYGGQTYKENFHYMGWDFDTLKSDLECIGFKNIKRYDWRIVEDTYINDFSKSYLPHDPEAIITGNFNSNHTLMSLNIECTK